MTTSPRKILILISLVVIFCACKKEIPNPEMLDPIYQDLLKDLKAQKADLTNEEKNLETLLKESKKILPRTVEIKVSQKEIRKSQQKISDLRQKVKFLEIRSERRRIEGRRAYKIAFSKGENWPNPQEYEYYQTNKRLVSAPLNWGLRVPKLDKGNPNFMNRNTASKEKGGEKK